MGGKRTLAYPLISQFSHADAPQRQPEHHQQNEPPWDAGNEHQHRDQPRLNDYRSAFPQPDPQWTLARAALS